ncbi:alpha/beta hydrolase [Amycolatopsis thermalba]|uniref:Alpha/beta hydrolase n=1 Tax=Amycolatopsis thermalba TaxID=944492 RepID=A0ABY4NPX7_9PSEU|nr:MULTISPECIES: alpha/beta hydrolase [Amycolatopsis]UQS21623.1 alpha/beta hydrolase [Amycolatopsis thermalba]
MSDFVLVHSPLVGPATWQRVAAELRSRGHRVTTPSLLGALDGPGPYYPKLFDAAAEPGILVAHSGAGALLPGIAARTHAPRAIFVDALLPHPGRGWFDTAPPELAERLRGLATDGRLPPWHEWFPPGTVEDLLPDQRTRDEFLAELPRVPLAYFTEPAPEAALPPSAYLQLSAAYDEEAREAAARGWPVQRLDAHHLAPLTAPAEIAAALERFE